jgi:hypothetical protein
VPEQEGTLPARGHDRRGGQDRLGEVGARGGRVAGAAEENVAGAGRLVPEQRSTAAASVTRSEPRKSMVGIEIRKGRMLCGVTHVVDPLLSPTYQDIQRQRGGRWNRFYPPSDHKHFPLHYHSFHVSSFARN